MSNLFPQIEPYNKGRLQVSDIHQLYFEESGNKSGLPVIFLHGGPGGGTSPRDRRFFDPTVYRIVLLDQRGSGKSTPPASIVQNTTWDLVDDIEKLREKLNIDKWVVFGGSWGSALSLIYAETHPTRVLALILRGVFMLRPEEIKWLYQYGAHHIYPDMWEIFKAPIPEIERDDFITAYHKRLTGDNEQQKQECERAWTKWECSVSRLRLDLKYINNGISDEFSRKFSQLENFYFYNKGFLKSENQILDNTDIIVDYNIPVTIIHGRYDIVCPIKNSFDLKSKISYAELIIIDDAGHSPGEAGISEALIAATNKFAQKFFKR